jgi:hypothetical protein
MAQMVAGRQGGHQLIISYAGCAQAGRIIGQGNQGRIERAGL